MILGVAGVFGFYMAWNIGANDVANAMGTSVGSGALTFRRAVVLAGIFEFAGAMLVGGTVTETIVYYLQGYSLDARNIAGLIGAKAENVLKMPAEPPVAALDDAHVLVVVGDDLAAKTDELCRFLRDVEHLRFRLRRSAGGIDADNVALAAVLRESDDHARMR